MFFVLVPHAFVPVITMLFAPVPREIVALTVPLAFNVKGTLAPLLVKLICSLVSSLLFALKL